MLQRKKNYVVFAVALIFLAVLLVSCATSTSSVSSGKSCICENVPTFPALPTCLPLSSTLEVPKYRQPRFFYVLIDHSGSYNEHKNYILQALRSAFEEGLQGGDELAVSLVGTNSTDVSHLVVPPTMIPLLPTPVVPTMPSTPTAMKIECELTPTLMPLPGGAPPSKANEWKNREKQIMECNERIEATAAAIRSTAAAYREKWGQCDQGEWGVGVAESFQSWHEKEQKIRLEAIHHITQQIEVAMDREQSEGTTDMYAALSIASLILESKAKEGKFGEVILLVLSDGKSTDTPRGWEFHFDGVKVVMAMVPYDSGYSSREKQWRNWFLSHGALSFEMFPDYSPDELKKVFIVTH